MNQSFPQNPYARRAPFEQHYRPPGSQGPGIPGPNLQSPQGSPFQKSPRHSTPFKSPPARPNMGFTPYGVPGRSPNSNDNRAQSFNQSPRFGGPPGIRPFSHPGNRFDRRKSGNFGSNCNSPNTSWRNNGNGGRRTSGNWMDRDCNPGGSGDITKYYKHSMVEDPWRNVAPTPVKAQLKA